MAGKGAVFHPKPRPRTNKYSPGSGKDSQTTNNNSSKTKTYADGYNKAVKEFNARKSNDKPQIAALTKMLGKTGFESALRIKLGNISRGITQQKTILLDDYAKRAAQLEGSRSDNRKAEADSSFINLANRARERGDLLAQTSAQGAGESDTLKSSMQALRNWSANQNDVNRSFYDTNRSINSEIVDLNAGTRTGLADLYTKGYANKEQVWTNYYNQRSDAYTQMGNIQANPQSDAYKKNSSSFGKVAKETGKAWKNPGIPKDIMGWKGTIQANEQRLNNSTTDLDHVNDLGVKPPSKKPEGATLRQW